VQASARAIDVRPTIRLVPTGQSKDNHLASRGEELVDQRVKVHRNKVEFQADFGSTVSDDETDTFTHGVPGVGVHFDLNPRSIFVVTPAIAVTIDDPDSDSKTTAFVSVTGPP